MSQIDSIYLRAIEEKALWPDHFFEPDMGGTMGGEACHFLDLATHLAGAEPVEIYARGDELVSPVIMLTFANGAVAKGILRAVPLQGRSDRRRGTAVSADFRDNPKGQCPGIRPVLPQNGGVPQAGGG